MDSPSSSPGVPVLGPSATGRPVTVLVAVVLATGAFATAFGISDALSGIASSALPEPWRLALVAGIVLLGNLTQLNIRFGKDQYTVTWAETAVVLGLVLLPWPWLTLVAPASVAVGQLVRRRSPGKVAFSAMSAATGTTLAQAVAQACLGGGPVERLDSPRTVGALVVAATVYFLWNTGTGTLAVALSQGLPWSLVLRRGGVLYLSGLGGNTLVALVLASAEWTERTLATVPPFLVLLFLAYRGFVRAIEDRDVWRELDRTSRDISRLEESGVAAAAVVRAAQLFNADFVEMALYDPVRAGVLCVHGGSAGGGTTVRHEHGAGWWSAEAVRGMPVPAGPGGATRVCVPLEGLSGEFGVLCLRFSGSTGLTDRDSEVLQTFRHTVATSLQNARLYEGMRAQAERSAYEAAHDSLTGLANRARLQEELQRVLEASDGGGRSCALMILDLDHFKEINDTLGHTAGDVLLRDVARRLTGVLRATDTIARLGGDEFAILLGDVDDNVTADGVAADLLRVVVQPTFYEGIRLSVEASIGIACYPADGSSIEELFRCADIAMYQAKSSRGSVQRYRSDRDDSTVSRLALVAELRSAIDYGELVLHYQPQVELSTGEVVGFEALVRWQHPTRGLLAPQHFIPVAEHSALVQDFTLHVLERALQHCAGWADAGRPVSVAVNLSARNLLDPTLPRRVSEALARHEVPAFRLVMEITETTMMSELDVVEQVLSGLRRLGVQLAVDDFGTGYSSLAFLQRVAVNEIKVDRSFVLGMARSAGDAAIVRATVELAHSLGLRVVAEGVESSELLDALRALGCDAAQGYHLGRPVGVESTWEILGVGEPRAHSPARAPSYALPATG